MPMTQITYSQIRGAPVNLADFVPPSATSGFEPYINTALQYCVDNERDLFVDRIYPITTPLTLNRPTVNSSGAVVDTYDFTIMTIFSDGGGFSIASDFAGIFQCTFQYSGVPYRPTTENIRFLNVKFIADVATRSTTVIKGGTSTSPTFLRTTFEHCQFEKIKLVDDSYYSYLQSWYLVNCLATAWQGDFMAADRSFDIQVIGGRYEGTTSGNCFRLTNSHGSKFWTQIESVSGTAIGINASVGVDISCYFEANGRDVDTINALDAQLAIDLGTYYTKGIHIHGTQFSNTASVAAPSVIWNTNCRGCSSVGSTGAVSNNSYTHLLDGTNFVSEQTVDINDTAEGTGTVSSFDAYANSGLRQSDAAPVGFSVSAISNTDWFTTGSVTFVYSKAGGFVNINFIATITATTTTSANVLIIENFGYEPTEAASGYMVGMVVVDTTEYPLVVASDGSFKTLVNALPVKTVGQTLTVRAVIGYPSAIQ